MPKKILCVDDEPGVVKIIADKMKMMGYEAVTASSGDEALKSVAASKPDLIICDLQMPGLDGLEVSRRIKSSPATKAIPMILLSALVAEDSEGEGLQKGDYFMSKPFNMERLAAKVKEMLNDAS